jgi:hypothetical protein
VSSLNFLKNAHDVGNTASHGKGRTWTQGGKKEKTGATVQDMPQIVPIIVESFHWEAPFGAKGIGEPAAATTAPAIANAIFDAVGIRIKDLPITPEKVLAALKEKERSKGKAPGLS